MEKILVFDMDGTIADLYGCKYWLEDIMAKKVNPYANAKPLVDMGELAVMLEMLKRCGWKIAVTSWLAKNSDTDYDKRVSRAKEKWLERNSFPYDFLNIVEYGKDKSSVTESLGGYQILFDDEEPNRKAWRNGLAVEPKNILDFLECLLIEEIG